MLSTHIVTVKIKFFKKKKTKTKNTVWRNTIAINNVLKNYKTIFSISSILKK
jgi:hypothetical protein